MPVNLRRNPWTGADQSVRKLAESHAIPGSGSYREITLAEVPRQDTDTSVRVFEAGSGSEEQVNEDTHVYEGNPTTVYNTLNHCNTGRDGTGLFYRYRPMLKWTGSLPALVDQVLLRIYLEGPTSFAGYPGERTIGVHEIQASWNQATAHWNNQPAHNLVADAQFKVTYVGWYDVDITALYQKWIAGNNYGLMLKEGQDSDVDNLRTFTSVNAASANKPKLVIAEPGDIYSEVPASTTPAPGQYAINYELGMLRFNPADGGKTIYVDYWGTGSLLWA